MLVHVFATLLSEEEEGTSFFPDFIQRAAEATEIESIRRDGEYLVIDGIKKTKSKKKNRTKRKPFTVEWPSGALYQKLRGTHSKRTLPVIWRMCQYYYGGVNNIASGTLHSYLEKEHQVVLENSPFCLEGNGSLSTSCHHSKVTFPDDLNAKQVEITVDKRSTNVILLPHRGVARTLLLLLKGFL